MTAKVITLCLCAVIIGTALAGNPPGTQTKEHQCTPYKLGEPISFECWNTTTNTWGPPPICVESSAAMSFNFGVDKFQYCSWFVDAALYARFKDVTHGHASLSCRVQMAPDHNVWLPLSIPVWAFVEADHIHIDNHVNFIFHATRGKLLALQRILFGIDFNSSAQASRSPSTEP